MQYLQQMGKNAYFPSNIMELPTIDVQKLIQAMEKLGVPSK